MNRKTKSRKKMSMRIFAWNANFISHNINPTLAFMEHFNSIICTCWRWSSFQHSHKKVVNWIGVRSSNWHTVHINRTWLLTWKVMQFHNFPHFEERRRCHIFGRCFYIFFLRNSFIAVEKTPNGIICAL